MGQRKRGQPSIVEAKRIQEGRGQGTGSGYRPWIETHDFSSKGQRNRVLGTITNRVHHLMSQLELHFFYMAEWYPVAHDIREQFPLPLAETVEIAAKLGLRHPEDSGEHVTMTTDFLITLDTPNGLVDVARTVKPSKELDRMRVLEKLEIEKVYWTQRGTDWGIVTEKELSADLVHNAELVRGYESVRVLSIHRDGVPNVDAVLRRLLQATPQLPLRDICRVCERELGYEPGTAMAVMKHLIAARVWKVDMYTAIRPDQPLLVDDIGSWPAAVWKED